MRIVYILTSLGIGGAERQALSIAESMVARGHQVAVLILRPRLAEEWVTALSVYHLDMKRTPLSFAASIIRARQILRRISPDLIHSQSFHANIFARMLKPLFPGTAVISTIHNACEGRARRMLAYRVTDSLARRTTTVSHASANHFVRFKAVPARKCIAIPNAIDLSVFTPDPNLRRQMRATFGAVSDPDFIWLAAGRYVPAKDFPNLLRAFVEVSKVAPHAQLWIAGQSSDGQKEQGRGKDSISAVLESAPRQVCFLGLRRDMPALHDAADAFVLSSAWEGMPLVLAEAMAMEKPIVATDVGGVRELLGDTGVLVPPKDPAALAQAMLAVMSRPHQDRQAQGRAARRRIAENFNINARAEEWESFYRGLLGKRA